MEPAGAPIGHQRAVAERPHAWPVRHLQVLVHENATATLRNSEGGHEGVRRRAGGPDEDVRLDRPPVAQLDDVVLHPSDLGASDDLDPARGELPLRVGTELGAELGEDDGVRRDEDHPEVVLAEVRIEAQRLAHDPSARIR